MYVDDSLEALHVDAEALKHVAGKFEKYIDIT
jgi:hypothetical protein